MNARIIQDPKDDKELLASLVDLMGAIDGGDNSEEFQNIKEEILESGITTEQMLALFGEEFSGMLVNRQIFDVPTQLLTDTAHLPTYSHDTDACADIYADEDVTIQPGETHCVSTGLALAIPNGYMCHIYARSGLSVKSPLRLANSVGIIDAGYRDELKVPVWNTGNVPYHIEKGMRIAQMDIMPSPGMEFKVVDDVKSIGEDRRGGFGSSGMFDAVSETNG